MIDNRIKAFTIMEVSITMLIAAIVIGITYSVYTIVNGTYNSFHRKNVDMGVVLRLDELLKRDMLHADIVLKDEKGITLKSTDRLINYEITPEYTIRTAGIIDTFKVKMHDLSITFEKQPVTEIYPIEEQNRVDDLSFVLTLESQSIGCHYHKIYSSLNLIKKDTNAVN